jgi:hypothetical protein
LEVFLLELSTMFTKVDCAEEEKSKAISDACGPRMERHCGTWRLSSLLTSTHVPFHWYVSSLEH